MKLTLINDDNILLAEWSMGDTPEFYIEDLDASPKHDFYIENNFDNEKTFGEVGWKESEWHYAKELEGRRKNGNT